MLVLNLFQRTERYIHIFHHFKESGHQQLVLNSMEYSRRFQCIALYVYGIVCVSGVINPLDEPEMA